MKQQSNHTTADSEQADHIRSEPRETYLEKFKDPRWQKMSLEVMNRDGFTCQLCFDSESTVNVHHRYYEDDKNPWEYSLEALVTLCETCHEKETENRPVEERALLRALKEHFFSAEVNCLAHGFMFMKPTHMPEVVAAAIEWMLLNPEVQREMVAGYHAYLAKKRLTSFS